MYMRTWVMVVHCYNQGSVRILGQGNKNLSMKIMNQKQNRCDPMTPHNASSYQRRNKSVTYNRQKGNGGDIVPQLNLLLRLNYGGLLSRSLNNRSDPTRGEDSRNNETKPSTPALDGHPSTGGHRNYCTNLTSYKRTDDSW